MTTVLITGASSGLGEEMARQFAARGYNLALCARRLERLEALREELAARHLHVDVQVAALDVTDPAAVSEVFHAFAEHFGGLDRVVANAGIGDGAALGTGGAERNRRTMETNVLGLLAQVESALEIFRAQGRGHLVLVSSFAAVRGMRRSMTAYGASKAAVTSIGEGLRVENIPGVDVTTLCPGYIATDMNADPKNKPPFLTDTVTGVNSMVRAMEARKNVAYIPWWPWTLMARIMRILPAGIVRRIT